MKNNHRKIIHADCDCFYAAVEMRDDPYLRDRPMAVGGSTDRRGVISTCNYLARAYGVHSAMPTAVAKRLCPSLVLVPHRMDKYRDASLKIRDIFNDYTELVEPLSLDEAFLDVTDSLHCQGSATLIAEEIRQRVVDEVGITISAGVAENKFIAKVSSDWNKPNGLHVVTPEQTETFVAALEVSKIYGVGKVTATKLKALGINTCADVHGFSEIELVRHFGRFGERLYRLARGIDTRPVKAERIRKSLSVEHTYADDLNNKGACIKALPQLFTELLVRLNRKQADACIEKQFVKCKFNNFKSTTMECVTSGNPKYSIFQHLMSQAVERGDGMGVRLMGVGVRFKAQENASKQLVLF